MFQFSFNGIPFPFPPQQSSQQPPSPPEIKRYKAEKNEVIQDAEFEEIKPLS